MSCVDCSLCSCSRMMSHHLSFSNDLWVFLMVFHICLVLLFIGHLELIADFRVLQLIPHDIFIGNGFVGLTVAAFALVLFLRTYQTVGTDDVDELREDDE